MNPSTYKPHLDIKLSEQFTTHRDISLLGPRHANNLVAFVAPLVSCLSVMSVRGQCRSPSPSQLLFAAVLFLLNAIVTS